MKKIEKLLTSLSDHQPIIDGLSEIKVEAGWKLQQPNGVNCSWWSSTEFTSNNAISRELNNNSSYEIWNQCSKGAGVPVRCLKNYTRCAVEIVNK